MRLAGLARGRIVNARARVAGVLSVAVLAGLVAHTLWPIMWGLGFILVLACERFVQKRLLAACEAGRAPAKLHWPLIWTFLQSVYGNCIVVWLWFAPYPHAETLATFYLMGGLANAAASLRADVRFMLAGAAPALACFFILPAFCFAAHGFADPLDLLPALAAGLFLAFSLTIWRSLHASDIAHWRAEIAAQRAAEAAASAAAAKTNTIARVQAEVRTPMRAMIGAAEHVMRTARGGDAGGHIAALVEAGKVMRAVLQDISDLDALETGALRLQPGPCDPRELARSVVGAFRAQAQDKGLELFLDIDDGVPGLVEIDAVRVRQVLFNLVANAVAFTRHGGVRVRLQAKAADEPGLVRMGFAVADTGVGMSRSQVALLFRDDPAASNQDARGVAICRRLARLMRAKLNAKSELGEGSMVSFVLDAPVLAAHAPGPRQAKG